MNAVVLLDTSSQACELANDQVHAAGAFDVDFKTDAAARSRATPCSPTLSGKTSEHDISINGIRKILEVHVRNREVVFNTLYRGWSRSKRLDVG